MSDAADLLHDVLKRLDGRHSEQVVRAAFGRSISSLSDMARASSLIGVHASVHQALPPAWNDGHDGALIAKTGSGWVSTIRRDGTLTTMPTGTANLHDGPLLYLRVLPEAEAAKVSFAHLEARARKTFAHVAWQSLVINLCALAVPFFTMAVYDRVLGGGAAHSLPALLSGAAIVLIIMILLRRVRSGLAATEYASISNLISILLVGKSLRAADKQSVGKNSAAIMSHVRQGERAAELFSTANVTAIYDAPFIVLTLISLVIVGGGMAIIPAVYLVMFLGLGLLIYTGGQQGDPFAVRQSQRRSQMIGELVDADGAIARAGLGYRWLDRFDATLRSNARDSNRMMRWAGAQSAIATTLGSGTALITLIVGIDLALSGHISPGTLIATMLLTWRVTGPAQALFLAIPRIRGIDSGWKSLKAQLSVPTVGQLAHLQGPMDEAAPSLQAQGLYFRYSNGQMPAVSGVTFDVAPGSVVVVIGPNGSGKSTLLQMIAGHIKPQSGHISANGRLLSQFDPDELDARCAFLGGEPRAGLEAEDHETPRGFQSASRQQEVAWDAVVQSDCNFFVLDNPLSGAVANAAEKVTAFVSARRGNATIVLATHNTDLANLADIAIILDGGNVVYCGPVQKEPAEAGAAVKETGDE